MPRRILGHEARRSLVQAGTPELGAALLVPQVRAELRGARVSCRPQARAFTAQIFHGLVDLIIESPQHRIEFLGFERSALHALRFLVHLLASMSTGSSGKKLMVPAVGVTVLYRRNTACVSRVGNLRSKYNFRDATVSVS